MSATATKPGHFRINGRVHHFGRIRSLTRHDKGRYEVVGTNGMTFKVEGGKAMGGTPREWFLDGCGGKSIICTSLMDALRCIESM